MLVSTLYLESWVAFESFLEENETPKVGSVRTDFFMASDDAGLMAGAGPSALGLADGAAFAFWGSALEVSCTSVFLVVSPVFAGLGDSAF
jgi:hypothetical protein